MIIPKMTAWLLFRPQVRESYKASLQCWSPIDVDHDDTLDDYHKVPYVGSITDLGREKNNLFISVHFLIFNLSIYDLY